ncbi:glycosyltransferase family 87 protein [Terriglobus sp.]|uniref:glycosyltransferase family 87 protein n=1 Tax=Terriglobus sp. TaxID=1889013 RepID=UPI003B0014DD
MTFAHPESHDRRLLWYALGSVLLVNVGIWAVYHLLGLGSPANMKGDWISFLHVRQWTDSWLPMLKSLDYFRDHPHEPIYYAKLYDTLIYPLPSLLPMVLLRRLGLQPHELRVLAWLNWLACFGVLGFSLVLARVELRRRGGSLSLASVFAVVVVWAGFYPLFKGYGLGNASTLLSCAFAALLWAWTDDRLPGNEQIAGTLIAAMTMVKPQFVLLVVWLALRKKWSALVSCLLFAGVLFAISFAYFGVQNNLDYLAILSSLSHKAQSHYANQSMFGTLNRMTFHGENLPYHPFVYSPNIPWIYRTTVLTSIVLTAAGLFFPWGRLRGSAGDLGAMAILSVAASPMAWEHHYGIVFAVLTWAWFAHGAWQSRRPWLLALAAFLTCNALTPIHQFLSGRVGWNVLQSYLYFGALLLVFLLMRLARSETDGKPVRL